MKSETQSKKALSEPTRSELEILKVLWRHGPLTVREVNNILNEETKEVHYTSTLKLMQIMLAKGLLRRNEENMSHVYLAAVGEQQTKGELLERFVSNLFEGSASKLVMQLLGNRKTSSQELEAMRKILKEMDKK
jgi:predicted transcriptional regulator